MSHAVCPDVIVYVCVNCVPEGGRLARQWKQDDARVLVREVPCTGKMDAQYLLHALEGGARGLCVVACPKGDCRLAQGNFRAEIRLRTLQRLLGEIGLEPERARLLHNSPDDRPGQLAEIVEQAVRELCALGPSPLAASHEL